MKRNIRLFLIICFSIASGTALADESGLNADAMAELRDAGVDKYLGTSRSTASEFGVWTKHDFDPNYVPDGTYPLGVRPDYASRKVMAMSGPNASRIDGG